MSDRHLEWEPMDYYSKGRETGMQIEHDRIMAILTERYQDLAWCTKDDRCHLYARGLFLGISDVDEAYANKIEVKDE